MYESSPDGTELWQGDVIDDLRLPRFEYSTTRFTYKLHADGNRSDDGQSVSGTSSFKAVVLSQCCEFTEGKRHSFSVAELKSLNDLVAEIEGLALNVAELLPITKVKLKGWDRDTLIASNTIDISSQANKLIYGYVYLPDGTALKEPHVADFTRITSISMRDKNYLLNSKLLQLTPEYRDQFKLKLAYFFSRPA
jgi:hypothetical protein